MCVWGYIGYFKVKLPTVVPFKNTPIFIYALNMRTIYPVIYSKYLFIYFSEPHWWRKIVSVLSSSAVDRGFFEPRSGQTEDYEKGIFFSPLAKHAAFRRKSNVWLPRNQNNVSEWSDMPIRGLSFL